VTNDFGLSYAFRLPELGSASSDLRIISEEMGDVTAPMDLEVSGRAGATYEMAVWNPALIESVEGAELVKNGAGEAKLRIHFAAKEGEGEQYSRQRVLIHLRAAKNPRGKVLKR